MSALLERRRHAVDLVSHLVAREFRLRYRRSVFGWLWAVGQPLARLAIFTFVFTRVLPLDIPNYGVFLFSGIIGWAWFSSGVLSATTSALDRRDLLFRPGLPRPVIPLVSVLTDGLDYIAALPVLFVFLLFNDGIQPTTPLVVLVLVPQLLLVLGIGYACCAANVFVRDVRLLVDVTLLLGFYVTPVFYDVDAVPDDYARLLQLNPMAHLLEAQRDVLVDGRIPELLPMAVVSAVAVAVFAGGYTVYARLCRRFVDEL